MRAERGEGARFCFAALRLESRRLGEIATHEQHREGKQRANGEGKAPAPGAQRRRVENELLQGEQRRAGGAVSAR